MLRQSKRSFPLLGSAGDALNKRIIFKNHDEKADHLLPHPPLLKVHAALAQMLEASGAALYLENLLDEREEMRVIAADGSTDLNSILGSRGLVEALV
jgi:hypothetical protein